MPVSAGFELKFASLARACELYAVAAGAVVYYQNLRTEREYVRAGPVPGVTLGCGRVKTNAIISPTAVGPARRCHRGVAHNPVAMSSPP